MEIALKQSEIEKGIVAYLVTQGVNTKNKIITVTLISGRKGNGHTANVNIEAMEEEGPGKENVVDIPEATKDIFNEPESMLG